MARATIDRLIINSPYRQQMGSGIPAPLLARQTAF